MTISEMVEYLQALKTTYGDLEVKTFSQDEEWSEPMLIPYYDWGKAKEVHIL